MYLQNRYFPSALEINIIKTNINNTKRIIEINRQNFVVDYSQTYKISFLALMIISEVKAVNPGNMYSQFITLTVSDLGFPKGAYNREICLMAELLDLQLCEPADAVQLASHIHDTVVIAMKPYKSTDGCLDMLIIKHMETENLILTDSGHPGKYWINKDKLVFRCNQIERP